MKSNFIALKRVINELIQILSVPQRKKSLWVMLSMIATSLLEMLGLSLIYPFLEFLSAPQLAKEKWFLKPIFYLKPNASFAEIVYALGGVIIIVFILKNGVAVLFSYIQQKFAANIRKELSTTLLSSYMRRDYEFFLNHNSAELIQGVESDIDSTYFVLVALFQFIGEAFTVLLLGIYLMSASIAISFVAMLVAAACFFIITLGFKRVVKHAGKKYRIAYEKKRQCELQAIHGIKEIMVSDRRGFFASEYNVAAGDFARASFINGFVVACPDRIIEAICVSAFMCVACVVFGLGSDFNSYIPVVGTFALGAFKVLPAVSKMSNRITSITFYQPGLHACYKNITEVRLHKEEGNLEEENKTKLEITHHFLNMLELKNVAWRYANSTEDVLKDVTMKIRKGEAIAFVGPSGAGKTTLADVILGLLHPQTGIVMMDGTDVFSIPEEWSRIIGYVPQSVYLLDDTIRANVTFGVEKSIVSDDKVWSALEQAQMADFVSGLPDGLNTMVGDRGIRFSGGQRQRIAIARALYNEPDILVLDEATAALDNETEAAVMESIERLQGQKTLIIIAHRLTTVKNCDRIYVIEDGVATETTYEKLV